MASDPLAALLPDPAAPAPTRPVRRSTLRTSAPAPAVAPRAQSAADGRQFLVVRQGQGEYRRVIIREIPTGSCAQWWSRADAWEWAMSIRTPSVKAVKRDQFLAPVVFVNPAGETSVVRERESLEEVA